MVYNYTKPRGPIAAQYSSPGPCYYLPGLVGQNRHDPRSVHFRGPGWAFGIRHGKYTNDCSPGPIYVPGNVYRDGKDGTPQYSLHYRTKDGQVDAGPGPGAYAPNSSMNCVYPSSAKYTFGLRHAERKYDDIPAANKYGLDPMLGKTIRSGKSASPIYSMTGRSKVGSFHQDMSQAPGPGTYTVTRPAVYKNKGPEYSMTSRNQMPGDSTKIPGPGSHHPEMVMNAYRKSAPTFSFGIRHSQYKGEFITAADSN